MGVGVRAHLVPVRHLLAHQPRPARHVRADQEKCRWHVVAAEDGQDLRRPGRVGSVVECQRHSAGRHRIAARAGARGVEHRAAVQHGGWGRGSPGVRLARTVLAENPAGVALDKEPDHKREHDHAHQDPVPVRGAASPVTSAAGRSARPTGHGLTCAGSASWYGPVRAASSLPGWSELAIRWTCSGLVTTMRTAAETAAGRRTATAAGRRTATARRPSARTAAPGPGSCARPRPGAGPAGRRLRRAGSPRR